MAEETKVPPRWMVIARHFAMPGGVFDYGTADIMKFCSSFEEADEYARDLFEKTHETLIQSTVWVLRCEKTYKEGAIIISER